MNVKKALIDLFPLFENKLPVGRVGDGISKPHLLDMQRRLEEEILPSLTSAENELEIAKIHAGDSEETLELIEKYENYIKILTKANRWAGWIQAILTVYKISTLEEMKELNKNS